MKNKRVIWLCIWLALSVVGLLVGVKGYASLIQAFANTVDSQQIAVAGGQLLIGALCGEVFAIFGFITALLCFKKCEGAKYIPWGGVALSLILLVSVYRFIMPIVSPLVSATIQNNDMAAHAKYQRIYSKIVKESQRLIAQNQSPRGGAEFRLFLALENGWGVSEDKIEAQKWLHIALQKDNPLAIEYVERQQRSN